MKTFVSNQQGNWHIDNTISLADCLSLTKNHEINYPDMEVIDYEGFNVIDESIIDVGFKARASDYAIAQVKQDEIVYVQNRRGFAGISLAYLCRKYNKKLTLFMPASKEISDHQALCIEYGANPKFYRIAATRNLNVIASKYADENDAYFFPLGLRDKYVTAGAVRAIFDNLSKLRIKRLWCVISTGVLSRALQIALPNTEIFNVAVSRNIQNGELGRAHFDSYHKAFNTKADWLQSKIDIEDSYDAKGFEYMIKNGQKGDYFFSVAGNAPLPTIDKTLIASYRDWPKNEVK